MTDYCPIPGASQPKEPVRLIDIKELVNITHWMPLPKPPKEAHNE